MKKYKLEIVPNGTSLIHQIGSNEHYAIMTIVTQLADGTPDDKYSKQLVQHAEDVVATLNQASKANRAIAFVDELIHRGIVLQNTDVLQCASDCDLIKLEINDEDN